MISIFLISKFKYSPSLITLDLELSLLVLLVNEDSSLIGWAASIETPGSIILAILNERLRVGLLQMHTS